MKHKRYLAAFLFLILSASPVLQGQTIADLAKKTEEAKAKKAAKQAKTEGDKKDGSDSKDAPKKTFTNSDLTDVPAGATAPNGSADAKSDAKATDGKSASDAKDTPKTSPPSGEVKDEDWWRSHALALQRQRDADMTALVAARVHFDSLPDEAKGVLGVPVVDAWMKARAEISRLEGVVVNDDRAIFNFAEDARHAGVPPGWLREK